MRNMISIDQVRQYGFEFPHARDWLDNVAKDAALTTVPNTAVPAELLAYIDPQVVQILTTPRRAREIFPEVKKGDWITPYATWRVEELTGSTQPYSDYANGTTSGVNYNWPVREQYVFQTTITVGDREQAVNGAAGINLIGSKQRAAATTIDVDANRFALLGVEGREIYGILNDPNLPAPITAAPVGSGGSTAWEDKTTVQIYNDVLTLFNELVEQSAGIIEHDTPLKLVLSPGLSVRLGQATDFNVSVLDMLRKYFPNLDIVTVPELSGPAGETMLMVAEEVNGISTGNIGFGVKLMGMRVVPDLSSIRQKYVSSTYGGIILQPFAIAQMTGM